MAKLSRLLIVGLCVGIFSIAHAYAAEDGADPAPLKGAEGGPKFAESKGGEKGKISEPEYKLKAVYLNKFLQLFSWPDGAQVKSRAQVDICVAGEIENESDLDYFKGFLESDAVKKLTPTRRLIFLKPDSTDFEQCHIIYITRTEKARIRDIISAVESKPILTVSEVRGFAAKGGMVEFLIHNEKLRFTINTVSLQKHGLTVDPNLLRLAL